MKAYHVCIDPGHGPGCANMSPDRVYEEQEFAMDLGNRLAVLLRARGVKVSLTRGAGDYPSLSQRCRFSNAQGDVDLFVSLHSNAAGGSGWSAARGHLVFTWQAGEGASHNLAAQAILQQWRSAGIRQGASPLRHQAFAVLADTRAPAVLLEHGFHSNREDVRDLLDTKFRDLLAEADAKGILAYLGLPFDAPANPDRARIKLRFGLEEETLDYLQGYRFGADLLRKLAEGV